MIKLRQTPVNKSELHLVSSVKVSQVSDTTHLSPLMVDHNVVRLHISMHDTLAVTEVECLQKFIDVVTNIVVHETRIERTEVGIVHVFEYQTRRLTLAVTNDIKQGHNIRSSRQILQNLDLTLDLLLLHRLEDLDDAFLVVHDIDALKHLRILSAT